MSEVTDDTPVEIIDNQLAFVQQAEGLSRAQVLKRVAGPAMTQLLQPIYAAPISDEEAERIGPVDTLGGFKTFTGSASDILGIRCAGLWRQTLYQDIAELYAARTDLFFHGNVREVIGEAVEHTGVLVPLMVAAHIDKIEQTDETEVTNQYDFSAERVIEIMNREEFDRILSHLTQGPNGFLGRRSIGPEYFFSSFFFNFIDIHREGTEEEGSLLPVRNAYKVREGRVIDLSDEYHLAAAIKRRTIREDRNELKEVKHEFADSSGCPVRHRFEDAAGQKQEPLIVTAKKFLIAALKVAVDKTKESIDATEAAAELAEAV